VNFITVPFVVFFLGVLCGCRLLRDRPALFRVFLLAAGLVFYAAGGLYALPLLPWEAAVAWGAGRLAGRAAPRAPADAGLRSNEFECRTPKFLKNRRSLISQKTAGSGRASAIPVCFQQKANRYEAGRRWAAGIGIALCLSPLALLKYCEFFLGGLYDLGLDRLAVLVPPEIADWALPAGLSFYSFQAVAYIVDSYRHPEEKPASFADLLSYLAFFPTVLCGPILRPGDFLAQAARAPARAVDAAGSTALILSGLFKKVVLASFLSEHAVREVFALPETYSSGTVLLATYAYAVQIYCDFSGYTDLATGIAGFMGFTLPRNFDAPYSSCNIREFWRRWHITLSSWLRDYLYIPLGGNRKGSARHCVNLLLTMVLGGLWHGAHLRFIVWGLLHGAALVLPLLLRKVFPAAQGGSARGAPAASPALGPLCARFATFHYVCAAWVFFRAEDIPTALSILERIALWNEPGDMLPFTVPLAVAAGLVIQWAGPAVRAAFLHLQDAFCRPLQALLAALLAGLILRMGPDGVFPFIYFSF
jgi:D-alanyl-lipoteichoic acid acyltransferase DltB (MBOAT superfamily)